MKAVNTKTKIIALLTVLVLCLVGLLPIMTACNKNYDDFRKERNGEPQAGEFYTLQKAYDNGWLSIGDLRNIAYYWDGDGQREGFVPTPKIPEQLSEQIQQALKEDWAKYENYDEFSSIVTGLVYCGTYDNLIAVFILTGASVATSISEHRIGGFIFS